VEAVGAEHVLQLQRDRQGQVGLLVAIADGPRVGATVAGIDVDRAMTIGASGIELDAGAGNKASWQVGALHRKDAGTGLRPGGGSKRPGGGNNGRGPCRLVLLRFRVNGRVCLSAGTRIQQSLHGHGRKEYGGSADGEPDEAVRAGGPAPAAAIGDDG
jgi:hypothetical protein